MAYQSPISRVLQRPVRTLSVLRMIALWLRVYFKTQSETDVGEAMLVETDVDERIAPDRGAIYPYLFACVYILFVGWFALDRLPRDAYRRSLRSYASMIQAAKALFVARPTKMRNRQRSDHPLAVLTQQIDGPTNCYPSLHVALMTLSYQIIKDSPDIDEVMLAAMRRSCIDICRSAMTTKQHSIADVVGGNEVAKRTYLEHFDGRFEDLLSEILLELDNAELATIRSICDQQPEMLDLLDSLLATLEGWRPH